MKSTHFPLLRSSPAVGTGSYGALPSLGEGSSYAGSSLSASTLSEDDRKADDDSDEDDNNDQNERNGLLAVPRLRKQTQRKGKMRSGTSALEDVGMRSKDGEAASFEGVDGLGISVDSDEGDEEADEDDPVDNSP